MRAIAALVLVAACSQAEPPAERALPIIGGAVDHDHGSVVLLDLAGYGVCSGTLVAPRVVLTAAHCVKDVIEAGFDDFIIVNFGETWANPDEQIWAARAVHHKRYIDASFGAFDVAMIQLTVDATVPPTALNESDMAETVSLDATVHSVGYGLDGSGNLGVRRHGDLPIIWIKPRHIVIGGSGLTVCNGDSGGPDFFTFPDGVERVVGVHSFGFAGCTGQATSMRVDAFLEQFIHPLLDAWDGPCKTDGVCVTEGCRSVDADCDPCGFEGTCVRECALPDLDCPLAGIPGDACADVYDCETRRCIAARDDPSITYCTDECDPASPIAVCGGAMRCEPGPDGVDVCQFPTPTPTAQGSPCWSADVCRSGLCDETQHICVEECDPAAGPTACPSPWTCQESDLAPHVCRGDVEPDTGTRPFSSLCGAAGRGGGGWSAAGIVIAACALLARRRRNA